MKMDIGVDCVAFKLPNHLLVVLIDVLIDVMLPKRRLWKVLTNLSECGFQSTFQLTWSDAEAEADIHIVINRTVSDFVVACCHVQDTVQVSKREE